MSKKILNTAAVLNELKGQSAFFDKSNSHGKSPGKKDLINPSPYKPVNQKPNPDNRTEVLLYDRTPERTNVRNADRVKIRHAFDIFEDQLRELHTRQLEAVRAGKKKPSLGEMVQQALDKYIENEQQRKLEEKRTSGRTDEPSDERTNDQIWQLRLNLCMLTLQAYFLLFESPDSK